MPAPFSCAAKCVPLHAHFVMPPIVNASCDNVHGKEVMDQFSRTRLLLGSTAVDTLAHAHVAVFGLGGVGGICAETLARAGVGQLTIVDKDVVSETNINRQVLATHETIGRAKVDIMRERIAAINPACQVNAIQCFFLPDTADQFDFSAFDYAVDALDTVTAKLLFIETAHTAGTPFISCMGAANKVNPAGFKVADINKTKICPLAKIIRKESGKRGIKHFKVVYSEEDVLEPRPDETSEAPDPGRRTLPGTHPAVPPAAGLLLAAEVINDLVAG